jgi:hypothetical protein
VPAAAVVYTVFGFFMNAMYARFDPRGPMAMAIFDLLFLCASGWVAAWRTVSRVVLWFRPEPKRSESLGRV